jgi:DNA-binding transcriptional LysR family regulator
MDTSQLDFNLLVTLDTLLAERNVTHAARRLNMSQPALSTRLARLRDIFDDPLLIPVQRGMVPTQKALELQPRLHEALEAVRQVVATDSAFDPSGPKARSASRPAITRRAPCSCRWSTPCGRRRQAFVCLAQSGSHHPTRPDGAGAVDLAINRPQTAPEQLRMRTFCREEYVLIARSGHPDVKGDRP